MVTNTGKNHLATALRVKLTEGREEPAMEHHRGEIGTQRTMNTCPLPGMPNLKA
jgi:hypothetical protein